MEKKEQLQNIKHSLFGHMNDPLMKVLKKINFVFGKSLNAEELQKHRRFIERLGQMAAPKDDVTVDEFCVGDINCEAITPEIAHNPEYIILYAHGGGYNCGGLNYARILGGKMALFTGLKVVTFDYRLAPEHPYPAALDDCITLWDHLTGEGYDPDHIIVAGDSAGGNLALCLVQKLKALDRALPKGLLLFSPWTDMTCSNHSYETNFEIDPILTRKYVLSAAKVYVNDQGELSDPAFSPINGDLSGFPPVYIMAGKNEILLDDSRKLKDRIEKSGGSVILDIEKSGWHVYQLFPIPQARSAMKRLSEHVSGLLYNKP